MRKLGGIHTSTDYTAAADKSLDITLTLRMGPGYLVSPDKPEKCFRINPSIPAADEGLSEHYSKWPEQPDPA
jgi:hypothetical protein